MALRLLPFLAGLLPLIAMFGSLWIGVSHDVVESCNPVLDGCTSISATGRKPPGSYLFRAMMLPQTIVLGFLWYVSVLWLRSLNTSLARTWDVAILSSAVINVLALGMYVTFLGTSEPIYEFMRRIGIYFAYLGMTMAQLLVALVLHRIATASSQLRILKAARFMLTLCATAFLLGILNLVLKSVLEDADASENRIEWIATILLQCYFFVLFAVWRWTGAEISVRTR